MNDFLIIDNRVANIREAKIIKAVEIVTNEGIGTTEEPFRLVYSYWGMDGKLLAYRDTYIKKQEEEENGKRTD
jgi:hypothetical protein